MGPGGGGRCSGVEGADVGSNPSINNLDTARASAGTCMCGWKTVSAAVVVVFCPRVVYNGSMLIAPDTHSAATAGPDVSSLPQLQRPLVALIVGVDVYCLASALRNGSVCT